VLAQTNDAWHEQTGSEQSEVGESGEFQNQGCVHGVFPVAPMAWSIGNMTLWTNTGGKRQPIGQAAPTTRIVASAMGDGDECCPLDEKPNCLQ